MKNILLIFLIFATIASALAQVAATRPELTLDRGWSKIQSVRVDGTSEKFSFDVTGHASAGARLVFRFAEGAWIRTPRCTVPKHWSVYSVSRSDLVLELTSKARKRIRGTLTCSDEY